MLTETVFRSDDMPREDRFEAWQECLRRLIAPMGISSEHSADYTARQRLLHLGPLSVWPVTMHPARYRRTPRDVRTSDPEQYHLTLLLPGSGTLDVVQGDNRGTHRAPGLYMIDTSLPCHVVAEPGGPLISAIGVEVPKALIPPGVRRRAGLLLGRRVPGDRGFGALLAQFLVQLTSHTAHYRASDIPHLNTVLIDLVSGAMAHELDAEDALPVGTRERSMVLRVRDHVQRHLQDPDLSPATVAAAHHLSTRQLHRLFQDEGETVGRLIRSRRLEGARRDLSDPALRRQSVEAIAGRWGFTAAAHFSRVFRAAYGTPPGEYRRGAVAAHRPRRGRPRAVPPLPDTDRPGHR